MKKNISGPVLMLATILIIVAFQLYWLKNNYDREKRLLESKAGIVFRTAVFELQAKKLNLAAAAGKDGQKVSNVNVYLRDEEGKAIYIRKPEREQIVGITNVMRSAIKDSAKPEKETPPKMVVSINNFSGVVAADSIKKTINIQRNSNKDKIFQILYGIDSLLDSLKIVDIKKAVAAAFQQEKINIPFEVLRNDSATIPAADRNKPATADAEAMNKVTIGIAHPVTYTLAIQQPGFYLFKKILSPVLFSLFLVGVTLISFWVLYSNLNRQQRLTDIKNEFIGNITHELKTPISTVSVAIEAIQNFNVLENPERTREYLGIANNELQRLGLLVDKVLKLSMFENQQVELKQERFDLKQLAEEVMSSMKIQFEKHRAQVTLVTDGEDFLMMADRLHLLSVIYNLLDNALKYSRTSPVITLQVLQKEAGFELKVTDNGVGIPAAYCDKIFDKFFRVPSGDHHNVKGYGLGLSYVAHIVQQHRGIIAVKSEEGKGTTFTIYLPKSHDPY